MSDGPSFILFVSFPPAPDFPFRFFSGTLLLTRFFLLSLLLSFSFFYLVFISFYVLYLYNASVQFFFYLFIHRLS